MTHATPMIGPHQGQRLPVLDDYTLSDTRFVVLDVRSSPAYIKSTPSIYNPEDKGKAVYREDEVRG